MRFAGYKLDGMPSASIFIDGDVATGGGYIQNPQYADILGVIDTSGTNPKVATCQQAMNELTTVSATLASLPPTQTLGTIVVAPGNYDAEITVGSGRQVVNIDKIKLQTSPDEASELDITLDPATTVVVVNVAKGLAMAADTVIGVNGSYSVPVIFNFLPGAKLKLKADVGLYFPLLAPTASIKVPREFDALVGPLYTTRTVNIKGAEVDPYMSCP